MTGFIRNLEIDKAIEFFTQLSKERFDQDLQFKAELLLLKLYSTIRAGDTLSALQLAKSEVQPAVKGKVTTLLLTKEKSREAAGTDPGEHRVAEYLRRVPLHRRNQHFDRRSSRQSHRHRQPAFELQQRPPNCQFGATSAVDGRQTRQEKALAET